MNIGYGYVNFQFPTFGLSVKHDGCQLIVARFFNPQEEDLPLFSGYENEFSHEIVRQLKEYVKDYKFKFSLPYQLTGSELQLKVWHLMEELAPSELLTYGEVAKLIASAPRAVGGACGRNPLPVIVPCHRIVGSNNTLGGFNSGNIFFSIGIKKWLLNHEGIFL